MLHCLREITVEACWADVVPKLGAQDGEVALAAQCGQGWVLVAHLLFAPVLEKGVYPFSSAAEVQVAVVVVVVAAAK